MNKTALFQACAAICGERYVLMGDAITDDYCRDWTKRLSGQAAAVVLPESSEQVAALLRYCNRQQLALVPQGGHTGMSGGATPDGSGRQVVVAMRRLSRIRSLDKAARTITAEAGCSLAMLQEAAAAAKLFFPLNLGSKGSCQLGGNLATNAGGLNVLRYGNARDLCLGLEAVFADGSVLNGLSSLRKDNTGYDLKNLLIGSEGTLAVITAATMRLFAPSPPVATAWATVPSVEAALALLNELQAQTDNAVTAFEMIPRIAFELMQRYHPDWLLPFSPVPPLALLVEFSGGHLSSSLVVEAMASAEEQGLLSAAVFAHSERQRHEFWHWREMVPVVKAEHGKWARADVSLPLSALAAFVADVEKRLLAVSDGLYIIGFGHVGDGNLHIAVRPKDADPECYPQLTTALLDALYTCVSDYGGSFSAEHGIGQFKTAMMEKYKDPVALYVMRRIKQTLDPNHILNPGRVLCRHPD